jgi:hypothetical protein
MPPLDEAITRCRSQLRFIPFAAMRQARVLALLNEVTESHLSWAFLLDPLASTLNVSRWPLPSPRVLEMMYEFGPLMVSLMPNSDLNLALRDRNPGVAFAMPTDVFRSSLIHHYIGRAFNEYQLAACGYPVRANGDQVVVLAARGEGEPLYEDRDLLAMERVCAAFADELSVVEPARVLMPRHATPAEQTIALDSVFRPAKPSLYAQAVLALFYGGRREAADGTPLLPLALEADLRTHRDNHQRLGDIAPQDYAYAFSKNHLGRVLMLHLRATASAGYHLSAHEDLSQHARLYRLKAACRGLSRDRTTVYLTCLLLAEGLRDPAEIARRGGFAALKPSSAQKIINQAKRLVAEA